MLAARTAEALAKYHRTLTCYYIERDTAQYAQLRSVLKKTTHEYQVLHGSAAETIPQLLPVIGTSPLLAFLDPFGLVGMPFDLLVRVLRRGTGPGEVVSAPTELLINFSLVALRRIGGLLREIPATEQRRRTRASAMARLSESLGGEWWQGHMQRPGRESELAILDGFTDRIIGAVGREWRYLRIGVPKRPGGRAVYVLMLITGHDDGLWGFANAVSYSREYVTNLSSGGQSSLLDNEAELIRELKSNIRRALEERGVLRIRGDLAVLFGKTLGHAREKHVRAAVPRILIVAGANRVVTLHTETGEPNPDDSTPTHANNDCPTADDWCNGCSRDTMSRPWLGS